MPDFIETFTPVTRMAIGTKRKEQEPTPVPTTVSTPNGVFSKMSFAKMSFAKQPGKEEFMYNLFILIIVLFVVSSIFQTLAWYYNLDEKYSFGIGFAIAIVFVLFEYLFLIPANQLGYTMLNIVQLAMLAEVVNWLVFIIYVKYFRQEDVSTTCWVGISIMFIGVIVAYS